MAVITITIPDAVVNRVLNAYAVSFGYDAAVDGTKAAFTKAKVIQQIRDVTSSYEATIAAKAAAKTASDAVASEVTIT